MLWHTANHHTGDPTIILVGDEYHYFAEAMPVGGTLQQRTVAHAVSRDLFNWKELPPTITCGKPGEFDAFTIYHIDVFVHDGIWYMYYTGLDRSHGASGHDMVRFPAQDQQIGIAISNDGGITWKKHAGNPVLRADPRWYEQGIPRHATYQDKDFARVWFRDPCVMRDEKSGKFGMVVIARDAAKHPDESACLAWATSDDLMRWQPRPPVFSPGRFHTIETPSIFCHKPSGRHYVVYMTHNNWGAPVSVNDPYVTAGNFYAVSDNGWEGPYRAPADEVLMGAHERMRFGSQRLVEGLGGVWYLYGWLVLRPAPDDEPVEVSRGSVIPPPKVAKFMDNGEIHAHFNPAMADRAKPLPVSAAWSGKDFKGRTSHLLPGAFDHVIYSAKVTFERGERAGLILRSDDEGKRGWRFTADRRFGRIEFGLLDQPGFIDARSWTAKDSFELKVAAYGPVVEVYVDDRLMVMNVRYRDRIGRAGFFVECAAATFDNVKMMKFNDNAVPRIEKGQTVITPDSADAPA